MAAYRRIYDSRHLQADCQEPGSAPETTVGNRVWANCTFYVFNNYALRPLNIQAAVGHRVDEAYTLRMRTKEIVWSTQLSLSLSLSLSVTSAVSCRNESSGSVADEKH